MASSETYLYFIDIKDEDDSNYMVSMRVDGSPDFIEGRTLFLSVTNRNKENWDVEDIPRTKFKIVKVEYGVHQSYIGGVCSSSLDLFIYLEKIEEDV